MSDAHVVLMCVGTQGSCPEMMFVCTHIYVIAKRWHALRTSLDARTDDAEVEIWYMRDEGWMMREAK
jgi:hypothetical protein